MDTLPIELWLDIVPHIPYTPSSLTPLRLVNSKLNTLISTHEHTLVRTIKTQPPLNRSIALYPDLRLHTYVHLNMLQHRSSTLHSLSRTLEQITATEPELKWLTGRYASIHCAGLHLLYRLQDAGCYICRVELLQALPGTSLACLLFALVAAIHVLRIRGPEPIRATYGKGDASVRSDVELALEEVMLERGPGFFLNLLSATTSDGYGKAKDAVRVLEHELVHLPARQQPFPDGTAKPLTLISSLRRALAAREDVEVYQVVPIMWQILSSTGFDKIEPETVENLVNGNHVETGGKRMGF